MLALFLQRVAPPQWPNKIYERRFKKSLPAFLYCPFSCPCPSSHIACHSSRSSLMWIHSPSQTRHSPLHSWLRAPDQVHQPVRHTHCSRRCRTGWAWPSHRTAGAWKPANTHTHTHTNETQVQNIFIFYLEDRHAAPTCMVVLSTIMLSKVISG